MRHPLRHQPPLGGRQALLRVSDARPDVEVAFNAAAGARNALTLGQPRQDILSAPYHRPMASDRLRIGIVGCGDVAHRHYLPALADLAEYVHLVALMDPREEAAQATAKGIAAWSPGARVYTDLDAMLADGELDAVIDLAPAPRHGTVNQAVLDAGVHLYSAMPIA